MYTVDIEFAGKRPSGFSIREDGEYIIGADFVQWSSSDRTMVETLRYESVQRQQAALQRLVDAANFGLGAISDFNPMSPDYAALACPGQHQLASEEDRDSAGLGAGPPEPFTPSIRTLPPRAHGHPEGCECDKCTWIAETLERSFPLRQAESY